MADEFMIQDGPRLDAAELRAVAKLLDRVVESGGVRPLSEKVVAELRAGADADGRHIRLYRDDSLVAYANVDCSDADRPVVEIALDPCGESDSVGVLVLDRLVATTAGDIQLWCHGSQGNLANLVVDRGFALRRTLIRMRRDLSQALPKVDLPPGVRMRAFRVGEDEQAWLSLNSRAFADLPDQGGWGGSELAARLRAPWFDANGFLLAVREGERGGIDELVGFHWTKIHTDGADAGLGTRSERVGEVYVLGVDPAFQGTGLGTALTLLGLAYLASCGLTSVMLYVESDNLAAIHTYERLGFRRYAADSLFALKS
ncbi:MAG: mycothiol synthase [Candidatus Nanopelagicales bacterium]